jgi:hypothetical protein
VLRNLTIYQPAALLGKDCTLERQGGSGRYPPASHSTPRTNAKMADTSQGNGQIKSPATTHNKQLQNLDYTVIMCQLATSCTTVAVESGH